MRTEAFVCRKGCTYYLEKTCAKHYKYAVTRGPTSVLGSMGSPTAGFGFPQ
jgi:hypothetical protein